MSTTRISIATALVALAAAAPVAAARPVDPGYTAPTPTPPVQTVVVHESQFDLGDAAIGAAAAGGLIALGGAVVLVARRPREDSGAPVGAH
jgi:hypothetical protein